MEFREILKENIGKSKVILGQNPVEKLIIDLNEHPSIIITGETGSGKSILLDQILLQLIKKNTSLELEIIPVDTSGVELNLYQETNYTSFSAINDLDKSIVAFSRVLKEIEHRKNLLHESKVMTVEDYNAISESPLPMLLLAIDDDKLLLRKPDVEKMLSGIISQIYGLNIFIVLVTSDVHNKFFETDLNTLASVLISFDYTNITESEKNNIENSNNLEIGSFYAKIKDTQDKYFNFDFDDNIIKEVLDYV